MATPTQELQNPIADPVPVSAPPSSANVTNANHQQLLNIDPLSLQTVNSNTSPSDGSFDHQSTGMNNSNNPYNRLRVRVMKLSIGLCVLLAINSLITVYFNLEGQLYFWKLMESIGASVPDTYVSEEKKTTYIHISGANTQPTNNSINDHNDPNGKHFHRPPFITMFFSTLPNVIFSFLISSIVPLCGYYGAKHLDSRLLGCFSFCQFCSVCGGLVSFLILSWITFGAIPGGIKWVEKCEPTNYCCYPPGQAPSNPFLMGQHHKHHSHGGSDGSHSHEGHGHGHPIYGISSSTDPNSNQNLPQSTFCDATGLPLPEYEDQFRDCLLSAHKSYIPDPKYSDATKYPHLHHGMCSPMAHISLICPSEGPEEDRHDEDVLDDEEEGEGEHHHHHRSSHYGITKEEFDSAMKEFQKKFPQVHDRWIGEPVEIGGKIDDIDIENADDVEAEVAVDRALMTVESVDHSEGLRRSLGNTNSINKKPDLAVTKVGKNYKSKYHLNHKLGHNKKHLHTKTPGKKFYTKKLHLNDNYSSNLDHDDDSTYHLFHKYSRYLIEGPVTSAMTDYSTSNSDESKNSSESDPNHIHIHPDAVTPTTIGNALEAFKKLIESRKGKGKGSFDGDEGLVGLDEESKGKGKGKGKGDDDDDDKGKGKGKGKGDDDDDDDKGKGKGKGKDDDDDDDDKGKGKGKGKDDDDDDDDKGKGKGKGKDDDDDDDKGKGEGKGNDDDDDDDKGKGKGKGKDDDDDDDDKGKGKGKGKDDDDDDDKGKGKGKGKDDDDDDDDKGKGKGKGKDDDDSPEKSISMIPRDSDNKNLVQIIHPPRPWSKLRNHSKSLARPEIMTLRTSSSSSSSSPAYRNSSNEPLNQCKINPKALKVLHVIHSHLPSIIPELEFAMLLRLLISVPWLVLSTIGMVWGIKLLNAAQQGYRPFGNDSEGVALGNNLQTPMLMNTRTSNMPNVNTVTGNSNVNDGANLTNPYAVNYPTAVRAGSAE